MLQPHRVVNFFPRYLSSIDVSKIFPWEQKRESIFSQLSISEKKKKITVMQYFVVAPVITPVFIDYSAKKSGFEN